MDEARIVTCLDGPLKGQEHIVTITWDRPNVNILGYRYEIDGDHAWFAKDHGARSDYP